MACSNIRYGQGVTKEVGMVIFPFDMQWGVSVSNAFPFINIHPCQEGMVDMVVYLSVCPYFTRHTFLHLSGDLHIQLSGNLVALFILC